MRIGDKMAVHDVNEDVCDYEISHFKRIETEEIPAYIPAQWKIGTDNQDELEFILEIIKADHACGKRVTAFLVQGPAGIAKTLLGLTIAKKLAAPYEVINGNRSYDHIDLLGNVMLKGGNTEWLDGPLPSIIRATNLFGKGVLIINEINAMTEGTQIALNSMLDLQAEVVLTRNNSEKIKVEQDNQLIVFMTMNPGYLGTNRIQEAMKSRVYSIWAEYPSPETEAEILSEICDVQQKAALEITKFAQQIRKKDLEIPFPPGTRELKQWINLMKNDISPLAAFDVSIASKCCETKTQKAALLDLAVGEGFIEERFQFLFKIPRSKRHIGKPGQDSINMNETYIENTSILLKIEGKVSVKSIFV